jgi:hypothetical protein
MKNPTICQIFTPGSVRCAMFLEEICDEIVKEFSAITGAIGRVFRRTNYTSVLSHTCEDSLHS